MNMFTSSGCTFTRGLGRIFYFQPGHEEYPIYYMEPIQQIIRNAVDWCRPTLRRSGNPECTQVTEPLESVADGGKTHADIRIL